MDINGNTNQVFVGYRIQSSPMAENKSLNGNLRHFGSCWLVEAPFSVGEMSVWSEFLMFSSLLLVKIYK
jgi:hypothetical protein